MKSNNPILKKLGLAAGVALATASAPGFASDCLQQLRALDRQLAGYQEQLETDDSQEPGGLLKTVSQPEVEKIENLRKSAEVLYYAGRDDACMDTAFEARKLLNSAARPGVVTVSKIMGYQVKNPNGETLGEIEDIVLDVSEDRIAYVVIAFGGFLGLGEELTPVPFSALVPAVDEAAFILPMTPERLEKAPRYSVSKMPEMNDQEWGKSIHAYYGQRPYWERNKGVPLASEQDAQQTQPQAGAEQEAKTPSEPQAQATTASQ